MGRFDFSTRPWLDLYTIDFARLRHEKAIEVKRISDISDPQSEQEADKEEGEEQNSSPPSFNIQELPSEILTSIFSRLDAEDLSALAQVSRTLMCIAYDQNIWRRIAEKTWPSEKTRVLERRLYQYLNWRRMVTQRPRLRMNGIYVLRHRFPKVACHVPGGEPHAPVFWMIYYRYLRFYTDGTVIELTTPEPPHLAFKRVRRNPGYVKPSVVPSSVGEYEFDEETGSVSMSIPTYDQRYPQMRSGIRCIHCSLQGTIPGAFNRLFVIDHYVTSEQGNDMVRFNNHSLTEKPYKYVRLHDFKNRIYEEFPRDDSNDLAEMYEMKKQARRNKKREMHEALQRINAQP